VRRVLPGLGLVAFRAVAQVRAEVAMTFTWHEAMLLNFAAGVVLGFVFGVVADSFD
jgi:hypothetical protein